MLSIRTSATCRSASALPRTRRLVVSAPTNGNLAPPGDYLLFLVSSDGVPSIGRWISVGTGPADVGVLPLPRPALEIAAAVNPSRSTAVVRYGIPVALAGERFRLAVYDVAGRRVRVLAQGAAEAGEHFASWDLLDDGGERVRGGIYFLRLTAGSASRSTNLSVLR